MKNMPTSDNIDLKDFTPVCLIKELNEKEGKRFIVKDTEIAVFKFEDKIYALSNICPHQHTAMIYDGFIEKGCVVCPAHGWMFDIKTGKTPTGGRGIEIYETKVFEDKVFVKVHKKDLKW